MRIGLKQRFLMQLFLWPVRRVASRHLCLTIRSWSYAQSLDFFSRATAHTKDLVAAGVPVYHETHRGRALYNPWVCRDLVRALPDLMLTADYSHWCVQGAQDG